MSDIVLNMQVSLDGFVGGPNGEVDWAFPAFDEEFTEWSLEALGKAGVHVMGAATGAGLADYWQRPDIHERDRPFAEVMNRVPKVVFSKSLERVDWPETRIARGDLAEEVARLKAEVEGEILVHGGARFAQALSASKLIDRYDLMVHPVVLGRGLPLFREPIRLRLEQSLRFQSGAVLLTYRRAANEESGAGETGH